jgi:hypothetical protein
MFISRHNFKKLQDNQCSCHDDSAIKIKEDLIDISNLIAKAYLRLSKTKYWVSEDLDDISVRLEDIMYELSTHEVFDD